MYNNPPNLTPMTISTYLSKNVKLKVNTHMIGRDLPANKKKSPPQWTESSTVSDQIQLLLLKVRNDLLQYIKKNTETDSIHRFENPDEDIFQSINKCKVICDIIILLESETPKRITTHAAIATQLTNAEVKGLAEKSKNNSFNDPSNNLVLELKKLALIIKFSAELSDQRLFDNTASQMQFAGKLKEYEASLKNIKEKINLIGDSFARLKKPKLSEIQKLHNIKKAILVQMLNIIFENCLPLVEEDSKDEADFQKLIKEIDDLTLLKAIDLAQVLYCLQKILDAIRWAQSVLQNSLLQEKAELLAMQSKRAPEQKKQTPQPAFMTKSKLERLANVVGVCQFDVDEYDGIRLIHLERYPNTMDHEYETGLANCFKFSECKDYRERVKSSQLLSYAKQLQDILGEDEQKDLPWFTLRKVVLRSIVNLAEIHLKLALTQNRIDLVHQSVDWYCLLLPYSQPVVLSTLEKEQRELIANLSSGEANEAKLTDILKNSIKLKEQQKPFEISAVVQQLINTLLDYLTTLSRDTASKSLDELAVLFVPSVLNLIADINEDINKLLAVSSSKAAIELIEANAMLMSVMAKIVNLNEDLILTPKQGHRYTEDKINEMIKAYWDKKQFMALIAKENGEIDLQVYPYEIFIAAVIKHYQPKEIVDFARNAHIGLINYVTVALRLVQLREQAAQIQSFSYLIQLIETTAQLLQLSTVNFLKNIYQEISGIAAENQKEWLKNNLNIVVDECNQCLDEEKKPNWGNPEDSFQTVAPVSPLSLVHSASLWSECTEVSDTESEDLTPRNIVVEMEASDLDMSSDASLSNN